MSSTYFFAFKKNSKEKSSVTEKEMKNRTETRPPDLKIAVKNGGANQFIIVTWPYSLANHQEKAVHSKTHCLLICVHGHRVSVLSKQATALI